MKVHWWPNATLALLNMAREDAESVDRAVTLWASSGEGIVIASGGGVFPLFVGEHVVEFLIDVRQDAMHVERVRRA
jgi:hypothetical protein